MRRLTVFALALLAVLVLSGPSAAAPGKRGVSLDQ
jgi:hypothetical protein